MSNKSNNILFVFEGENTEEQIVKNLEEVFFGSENTIIKCVYGAEIYQIYKIMSEDEDLDLFELIKERKTNASKKRKTNAEILKSYERNDFAEIYLFFDYDGHSGKASDEKLGCLLEFFNEETDKGKLYISYPMVESLKHIACHESFKYLRVKCKKKTSTTKI